MKSYLHIFATLSVILAMSNDCRAAIDSPAMVSPYGQIQNVQNYSSNPFWSSNGSYKQGMPVPVYVTGPDLTSSDCMTAVSTLISMYCGMNNECLDMTLSDVRPAILLQLSRLDGHNYATSCIGYIDSEFEKYKKNHNSAIPNHTTNFPTGTVPNPTFNDTGYKIPSPADAPAPKWKQEMIQRKQELKQLQAQNGAGSENISPEVFPKTYNDLTFIERMDNAAAGFKPYEGKSPYNQITIKEQKVSSTPTPPTTQNTNSQSNQVTIAQNDMKIVQQCKADRVSYDDCLKRLKGTYPNIPDKNYDKLIQQIQNQIKTN